MKRSVSLLLPVLLLALLFSGCFMGSALFYSEFPSGYTDKREHFDPEGFQDHTDYCKYFYNTAEGFEKDERYLPVSEVGAERVKGYFENFAEFLENTERLDEYEYDFDPACITEDDLVYIVTKEGEPIGRYHHYGRYDDYDVFFFDRAACVLYYIHTNI